VREFDFLASELPSGLSVIEASAGTGKTHALSHLVPRMLLEGWADHIGQIVLVTFTNDAVRELSGRVREVMTRLAGEPSPDEARVAPGVAALRQRFGTAEHRRILQRALLDFDRLQISTIHSFCQRVLQAEGVLCGWPSPPELVSEVEEEWSRLAADWWCEVVAADPLLTEFAVSLGWNREDVARCARILTKEDGEVEWEPEPEDWSTLWAEVKAAPRRWRAEADLAPLRALLDQVSDKGWNKGASREIVEQELLAPLEPEKAGETLAESLLFWEALNRWPDLPKKIAKRSKDGQRIVAAVEALPVWKLAEEWQGLLPRLGWALVVQGAKTLSQRLARKIREQGVITYDGLIQTVRQALRGADGTVLAERLRERFRVALIDESQDTDAAQFDIFSRIFLGGPADSAVRRLVLIGDPKQSIYAFRGADVNTYLEAREHAGEAVFTLTKTFRAPSGLVAATNALLARPGSLARRGLECPEATSGLAGDWVLCAPGSAAPAARGTVWWVDDEIGEAEMDNAGRAMTRLVRAVAGEISFLLREGHVLRRVDGNGTTEERVLRPRDVAVLTNTHHEAEAMRQALLAQGVAARRAGSGDVLDTEEAEELFLLLRALQQPRHRKRRRTAFVTRLMGGTQTGLARWEEFPEEEDVWLERLLRWQQRWQQAGLAAALAEVDREMGVQLRLARRASGERRLANWRQLGDLLQGVARQHPGRITPVLRWLEKAWQSKGGTPPDERLQQLESEAEAVQIVTMHAAKGLQFPLVFLPFAWKSGRPASVDPIFLLRRKGRCPLVVGRELAAPENAQQARRDLLEDRLRLLYVACTRAQVALWLVAGQTGGTKRSYPCGPLDWILRPGDLRDDPPEEWWTEVASPGRGARHGQGWDEILAGGEAGLVAPWRRVPLPWPELPPPWDGGESGVPAGREEALQVLPAPVLKDPWRFTSFSALTREKHPRGESGAGFSAARESAIGPRRTEGAWTKFREVPGGVVVGSAVHDWIETWDFGALDRVALAGHLREYGLPGGEARWVAPVGDMLEELRGVHLPGLETDVARACPERRASEWHFQLPLDGPLEAAPLAEVFARHGEEEYAESLAALPVGEIQGYLHGFLDRLAVWNGSWGVIDWKTNQLGPEEDNYEPSALLASARASHYVLQTHLYLVALRRYLGPGVPLRGAWLIYLRGIASGTARGVCRIDPRPALLEDLDHLFRSPLLRPKA
jgi:exodeoxyribonuclease V beta subunit